MGDYECSMCGVQFGNRDELVNHLRDVHPTQKINDFECSTCGARFGSIDELVGHIGSVHPIVITQ